MGDPREILDRNVRATFNIPQSSMSALAVNHQSPVFLLARSNAWQQEHRPSEHCQCQLCFHV
jgi:hypothetical protein